MREVDSGRNRADLVAWVKFSTAAWTPDNQGLFYSGYDAPPEGLAYTGANYYHKLYYHRLGTPQSVDRLVYERRDHKDWGFAGEVTARLMAINLQQSASTAKPGTRPA